MKARDYKPLLSASINSPNIAATLTDMGHVQLQDAQIDAKVSNPLDEINPLSAFATLKLHHLTGEMDTISASISGLMATVSYIPDLLEKNLQEITLNYYSQTLEASVGDMASVETKGLKIDADAIYNSAETDRKSVV